MTNTPDETKKGLNDPIPVHFHIGDPEPRLTPLSLRDLEVLHTNALALIQQLEKRAIHLEALNQSNLTTITMQERTRARLQERISQLEAELDAMKEALGLMVYQYCVSGTELDHRYMCAGETAFRVLGLEQYGDTRTLESWLFPECQDKEE